jgi:hypothetical protein
MQITPTFGFRDSVRSLLVYWSTALLVAYSLDGAEIPSNIEQVKTRIVSQQKSLESLHLHVRRVTTHGVDDGGPAIMDHAGTDLLLEAFKGDKRYRRIMELDYSPLPFGQADLNVRAKNRRYLDAAKAWTGTRLLTRDAGPGSRRMGEHYQPKFEHQSITADKAQDEFPASSYLANVGLAPPDPTGRAPAQRNRQRMANVVELLHRRPYEVVRTEKVGSDTCLILEGEYDCFLPAGELSQMQKVTDKLWLDLERGLTIRQRQTRIGDELVLVTNDEVVEVLPGLWLPRKSNLKRWAAKGRRQDRPDFEQTLSLVFWIVNEVPDDLFEVALTRWERTSLFEVADAFHWRDKSVLVVEGWALKDVGIRIEERTESGRLVSLVVETPRWRLTWRPTRNRVTVQPSRLKQTDGYSLISANVRSRANVVRGNEAWTAMFSSRREQFGDRKVERLLAHYPPDPLLQGIVNLHHADPVALRTAPLPEVFYSRRYWFDPDTKRIVARQCGCKSGPDVNTDYEPNTMIDYPDSKSLPPDLFAFEIPPTADVSISDPKLRRVFASEGKPKEGKQ